MAYEITFLSASEMVTTKAALLLNGETIIAEIDGRNCYTKSDFFHQVSNALDFPVKDEKGWDAYFDWIRDLTWLDTGKGIALVVYFFSEFLKNEIQEKDFFLSSFKKIVFPFWKEEVCDCVVNGTPRLFYLYLVN